jgi:hypothetical protein
VREKRGRRRGREGKGWQGEAKGEREGDVFRICGNTRAFN